MTDSIFLLFIRWFFWQAPVEVLRTGRNFLTWTWRFFSIGYFVPRLFAPWHKDVSSYGRGFDLARFLHVWGWNFISRFIGAVLRLVVMAAGLVVFIFFTLLTLAAFILWYVLPILIVGLFFAGFITPTLRI
jgi:hypothetical protein